VKFGFVILNNLSDCILNLMLVIVDDMYKMQQWICCNGFGEVGIFGWRNVCDGWKVVVRLKTLRTGYHCGSCLLCEHDERVKADNVSSALTAVLT